MFDDLRAQFRKAVENFNEELNRNELSHNTNDLIGSMKDQVSEAISHINLLALQVSKAKTQMAEKARAAETCYRQAEIARRIGDTETAAVAMKYTEKHEEHARVLDNKIDALSAELFFLEEEVEEMVEKVEKAQTTRRPVSIDSIP